jgi:hypothetical protein
MNNTSEKGWKQVWSKLNCGLINKVSNEVGAEVWIQVKDEIQVPIWDQINNQVFSNVSDEIRTHVKNNMKL